MRYFYTSRDHHPRYWRDVHSYGGPDSGILVPANAFLADWTGASSRLEGILACHFRRVQRAQINHRPTDMSDRGAGTHHVRRYQPI